MICLVLPKKVGTSNWSVWPRLWGSNRPFKRQKGLVGLNTQVGSGERKVRLVLAIPMVGRGLFRDNNYLELFEKKNLLTSTSIFLSGCNVCIFNSRLFLLAAYFTMLLALSYFFLAINHLGLSAMKPAKGKVQIRPSPKAVQCSLVQIGMKYAKKLAKSKPIVWIGISNKARNSPEISNIKMKAVKQSPDLPRPKQK